MTLLYILLAIFALCAIALRFVWAMNSVELDVREGEDE